MKTKRIRLAKRKLSVRKKISGSTEKPRVNVYRSNKYIYAQIVDDTQMHTLAAHSDKAIAKGTKTEKAKEVGLELGKKLQAKKVKKVVFDRSGYIYHGRVKALADGLRESGVEF